MTVQLCERIAGALSVRSERGVLRTLGSSVPVGADFSSNDYLGFARPGPFQAFQTNFKASSEEVLSSGATGSRLLSGHSIQIALLEATAARFHLAETSLLFNSGYDANVSLLSCLPGHDDSVVYDELIHASVHDGMRMSRASTRLFPFRHNDVESLKQKIVLAISQHPGSVIVCIETLYSMDGDLAPVKEILDISASLQRILAREIHVLADEAHAGGVFGENGEGRVVDVGAHSHPNLLGRVVTFGKAFAAHGAVVLGSTTLRNYLINYARPFIYSTALPPHTVSILRSVYLFAKTTDARDARRRLWVLVDTFHSLARERLPPGSLIHEGRSPIQGILVPGNYKCMQFAGTLKKRGFDVYAIRRPTVPQGLERIRIIIHTHNTEAEVERLVDATAMLFKDLSARPRL